MPKRIYASLSAIPKPARGGHQQVVEVTVPPCEKWDEVLRAAGDNPDDDFMRRLRLQCRNKSPGILRKTIVLQNFGLAPNFNGSADPLAWGARHEVPPMSALDNFSIAAQCPDLYKELLSHGFQYPMTVGLGDFVPIISLAQQLASVVNYDDRGHRLHANVYGMGWDNELHFFGYVLDETPVP